LVLGVYRVCSECGGHELFRFWVLPSKAFTTKRTVFELHTLSNKVIKRDIARLTDDLSVIVVHTEVANEVVAVDVLFGHIYNL